MYQKAHIEGNSGEVSSNFASLSAFYQEKIDLVYLWVDGSDKKWLKKKENFKKKFGAKNEFSTEANHDCRFLNNDELKYSLRSVEKYAPWINHIFIITDNQIPEWFNTENTKATFINHDEILFPEALPCYNSNSIEHCITNIPNLSEYFILANDDMFLNKKVSPKNFYMENGDIIYRYFKVLPDTWISFYADALRNSAELVNEKFGINFLYAPHHNFDGYRKSLVKECYQMFKQDIDRCICSHFRNDKDIQRTIYSNYACAIGKGCLKKIEIYDIDLPFIIKKFRQFFHIPYQESLFMFTRTDDYKKTLKKYSPMFFCINDDELSTEADREHFKSFIKSYFPDKSSFEKPDTINKDESVVKKYFFNIFKTKKTSIYTKYYFLGIQFWYQKK